MHAMIREHLQINKRRRLINVYFPEVVSTRT